MINRTFSVSILFACAFNVAMVQAAETEITGGILEATGAGTVDMSKVKNKVQAKMMAKRAARVDAQRNLLEVVEGVRVTSGTTVKDAQLESDIIANRVKGMLKGAFVLDEMVEEMEDTYYAEVQLGICMDGAPAQCRQKPTLSTIVYASLEKTPESEQFTAEVPEEPEPMSYSGLVIDVTGHGFSPYLDVRVKTATGRELYGPGHIDPSKSSDWLHWAKSVESAQGMAAVIGELPLVVSASGIAGDSDIIVSDDVAVDIFRANVQNEDFLRSGRVVFVVN